MLVSIFLQLLHSIISTFSSVLPDASVLPFGIDAILVSGFGYIHFLSNLVPPLQIMLNGFLFVFGFKLVMMVVRAIPIIGRMVAARSHGFN
jgi:hypothetical protein